MSAGAKISDVYQDRITCFIDILGFSRDVAAIDANPALFLSVDAVLRHVSMCKLNIDHARARGGTSYDTRMSCFSDCLVVSYRCEPGATLRALWDAAYLGHVIIRPGYLPRGAMTVGKLYTTMSLSMAARWLRQRILKRTLSRLPGLPLRTAAWNLSVLTCPARVPRICWSILSGTTARVLLSTSWVPSGPSSRKSGDRSRPAKFTEKGLRRCSERCELRFHSGMPVLRTKERSES